MEASIECARHLGLYISRFCWSASLSSSRAPNLGNVVYSETASPPKTKEYELPGSDIGSVRPQRIGMLVRTSLCVLVHHLKDHDEVFIECLS